jgi:asparagine synthase (glutamine-hydrolysing)
MSIQFGRWNFEDQPPPPDYIKKVSGTLAPYGPDSNEAYSKGGVHILYRAFHTTKESRRETQPHVSQSGAVITWDGRLDNRAEIISELRDVLAFDSTDVAIVAAAYEEWGSDCFKKLIGDWAFSIWNPISRSLILAKDPIGVRHLYYAIDKDQVTWSTILDPLVLFAGKTFLVCEEYIAGWFATKCPAAHLTPYIGIHSLPPSSAMLLRAGKHMVSKYWDFDPGKRIRYRTDTEYEEHFRNVLATAVKRRLRSDRPVLAELSGGMDSSSIVCMADAVIARGEPLCPRLDTISWFDDSHDHLEPDSNELHWISEVEQKRGRTGYHINLNSLKKDTCLQESLASEFDNDHFAVTPNSGGRLPELFEQYAAHMKSREHRVVLSGIGGGEVTGDGVPTPRQELQNLLARARLFTLARQLKSWATKMKKPRLSLLWDAVRGFSPLALKEVSKDMPIARWFQPDFVRRNRAALWGYQSRVRLFGPLPSFQENVCALDADRRLLSDWTLRSDLLREVRFPYFDQGLLEFLYSIPREQIVRVGRRRHLMRRALVGIVPNQLLNRRRRAFLPPRPTTSKSAEWPSLAEIGKRIVSAHIGIVDPNRFLDAMKAARNNPEVPGSALISTLTLEFWLRHLITHRVLSHSDAVTGQDCTSVLRAKELQPDV